jgi:hypothetical protein
MYKTTAQSGRHPPSPDTPTPPGSQEPTVEATPVKPRQLGLAGVYFCGGKRAVRNSNLGEPMEKAAASATRRKPAGARPAPSPYQPMFSP